MFQSGLLADESGTIKFVIWHEEGVEKLEEGKVCTQLLRPGGCLKGPALPQPECRHLHGRRG